jgi:hypothetical protein
MNVIDWLVSLDPAIASMTRRDLLEESEIRNEWNQSLAEKPGIVSRILSCVDSTTKMWGGGIYSPKYKSTHYTLMDLTFLGIDPTDVHYQEGIHLVSNAMWPPLGLVRKNHHQDMCVSAMMLGMLAYGHSLSPKVNELVDYLIKGQMADGGFNCLWQKVPRPNSSSLHTTLSVLEAIDKYIRCGYLYRMNEVFALIQPAVEFVLTKRMFRSVRTGNIIHPDMLAWRFPSGWKYSIIRCLDCFQSLDIPYDSRMEEAIHYLVEHADEYGRLPAIAPHPGQYHFRYESTKGPSAFNTLRLCRIVKKYRPNVWNHWISKGIKQ